MNAYEHDRLRGFSNQLTLSESHEATKIYCIELLDKFKPILNLRDWVISFEILRSDQMSDKSNLGECRVCDLDKCAKISILHPFDWNHTDINPDKTFAHVFLHEMLHIFAKECGVSDDELMVVRLTAVLYPVIHGDS